MGINSYKSNGDLLLSLVGGNKAKNRIKTEIKNLEINGKFDSSECLALIKLYKHVQDIYNQELYNTSYERRQDLIMLWKGLNSNLPCYRNTTRMLEYDDKNLIFAKSLLDLGATQFHLYLGKPKTIMMKHVSELLSIKYEEIDNNVDDQTVDNYMTSDFFNIFYKVITDEINSTSDLKYKMKLYEFKYNMIYLFNPIESRAILTDFNIPEYPNMACDIEIETSGLSVDDYLSQFDSILAKLLEFAVNDAVSTVRRKHKDIDILDRLLLKTISCAITDKELLDSIIVDSTPFVECKNIVKNIDDINKILMDGKENSEQLKLYRRYLNI